MEEEKRHLIVKALVFYTNAWNNNNNNNNNKLKLKDYFMEMCQSKSVIVNADDVANVFNMNLVNENDKDEDEKWRQIGKYIRNYTNPVKRFATLSGLEKNDFGKVIDLFANAKNIIFVLGAGVSVACGIPDFRSYGSGLYHQIAEKYPDLGDPQLLFDLQYFKENPLPFFEFAKSIWPFSNNTTSASSSRIPSSSHEFVKKFQDSGTLLQCFTQNIDTLETVAGIRNDKCIYCHGSFATSTCLACGTTIDSKYITNNVINGIIPIHENCPFICQNIKKINKKRRKKSKKENDDDDDSNFFDNKVGIGETLRIYKPDIVFFGEPLPHLYYEKIEEIYEKCDLFVVMGSSLSAQPVSLLPSFVNSSVPQILINKEIIKKTNHQFDFNLLGEADIICNAISTSVFSSKSDKIEDKIIINNDNVHSPKKIDKNTFRFY